MAKKKRRDSERDPSTVQRVLKAGRVALAVGAGVALFSRSGLLEKSNRLFPALMDTKKTFQKEMLGKKGTAMNLYNAYNKSIGEKGQVFKDVLASKKGRPINPSTARTTNALGRIKNINQTSSSEIVKDFTRKKVLDARQGALEAILQDQQFKDKYTDEALSQLVRETAKKYKEVSDTRGNVSTDFLKRTIEMYGVDPTDAKEIVYRTAKAMRDVTKESLNQREIMPFIEDVKKLKFENFKKRTRDNDLINRIGKRFGIDNLDDKLLGSHKATVGEVLGNLKQLGLDDADDFEEVIRNRVKLRGHENDQFINTLKELKRKHTSGEIGSDVIFDEYLRVRTNKDGTLEFIDLTESMEHINSMKKKFDSSLVGRVLTKGIDREGMKNAPDSYMLHAGLKGTMSYLDNAEDQILKESRYVVGDTLYSILRDKDGNYRLGEELGKGTSINMLHGSFSGVLKSLLGSDKRDPLSATTPLLQKLDIGQTGRPNVFERMHQWFNKFSNPDWERNILNRDLDLLFGEGSLQEKIANRAAELGVSEIDVMARYHEDFKVVNSIFKSKASSNVFDDHGVAKLKTVVDELVNNNTFDPYSELGYSLSKMQNLLDLALSQDRPEDVLDALVSFNSNNKLIINNTRLQDILNSYQDNAARTLDRISIESTSTKKVPILDIEFSETNVMDISGIIRQEILKEITTEEDIMTVIKANSMAGFNGQELESLELLTQWQRWQKATTASDEDMLFTSLFAPGGSVDKYLNYINDPDHAADAYYMNTFMESFKKDYGVLHKGSFNGLHEDYAPEYNTYDFIPKSNIGMDLLKNINDTTKMKAALKELNAGRNDLQHTTSATLVVQYMINRLSMGVEEAGLALSDASTTSPLNTIKAMMLKRVLPAMAAYTAFDYLNDMSQDITGVGITGALANTVSNFDIMGRGLAYKTGLGQGLDWFKRTSVIAEYWTGSTDFQTAEERKEWYEEGYSPVRKSRFWGFGSSSEFRGGDISFFQPNYLRRIHSDYKDKVLYGSNKEKWAHSIVPTPTHPFSTVRYLMDPYWLERKHIDDAPTPLTGKMFSEGSFWGAILNPTVGEIIKPQIMLPEIKKRFTGKDHDVKGIVRKLNERIKRKASDYDDMLIVNGTDIRNATYVPYGNATPGTITLTGNGQIRGVGYMNNVNNISEYNAPDGSTYSEAEYGKTTTYLYEGTSQKAVNAIAQEMGRESKISQNIITNINNTIKNKGRVSNAYRTPDSTNEGTYIYNNLINEYYNFTDQYYSDRLDPAMINKNKYGDYLSDIGHSAKNLSGIYGFVYDKVFDDNSFSLRYENAGSYMSFSRGFWDAGLGGLGGGFMEIARRFFPSSDKSRIDYNPLVNNMPEWLPDKFHYGVPWTKVTKGEMRLPGKGYEALNELHPDEFADENGYGSFDKFKILADVAPNSSEYKIWHNIVKHHIKDPELKQEIKEIEARTKRMSGSHEFYEYQYLKTDTHYEHGVVKELNKDGTVTLVNNQVLTLAGIEFNDNYNGELGDFLKPGQKITYRTSTTVNDPTGEGVIRNAAIFIKDENINKRLMDMGVADRDMSDTSAIGNLATVGPVQEAWGGLQELIAHARIPFVHNKLMHIETPLESYISEQVYGANFQTWDHPIESFVKPMMNEVMGQGIIRRALARGYREFHFEKVLTRANTSLGGKAAKWGSGLILTTLDPAAMLGGGLAWMNRLNNGRFGEGRSMHGAFSKGAKIGGTVGDIAWAWTQADDPLSGAIAFGALAGDIYRKFEVAEFAEKVLKKSTDLKGAIGVGAAIGLGVSAMKNADWDKERLFGKWTPKKYKKINEMNEYFDRLEYIKYKGLYEDAARKAALLEGANIKDVFKQIDKNKAKIAKLKRKAEKLLEKYDEGDSAYKMKMEEIQQKIDSLQEAGNNVFKGGKYTKSAVAYKKAMESTIYGLSEGATKDEILAAIPDQYKDYFQKFIDVKDPKERKKILRYIPEYLQRPLQLAWGTKLSDVESNRKYFKTHKLPGVGWRGWKPNINLKHVKMKTIQNEGMILSDFGFYESEKGKASYTLAPDIENYDERSKFSMFNSIRLASEMKGFGISLSNVSIDRTSAPGMWVSADIKQSISDRTELATNSVGNMLQGLAANFI